MASPHPCIRLRELIPFRDLPAHAADLGITAEHLRKIRGGQRRAGLLGRHGPLAARMSARYAISVEDITGVRLPRGVRWYARATLGDVSAQLSAHLDEARREAFNGELADLWQRYSLGGAS